MEERAWRYFALSRLSWCGILFPFVTSLVNLSVAEIQPSYNMVADYISDLTSPTHPDHAVLRGWWILCGFLFFPFGFALREGNRGGRLGGVTPALALLFAVGIVFCGIFPCDDDCQGDSFTNKAHVISSAVASAALFPCPFFYWLSTRHNPHWRGLLWFDLVMQALFIGSTIMLVLAFLHQADNYQGLIERLFFTVCYCWMVVIGIKLFRMRKTG